MINKRGVELLGNALIGLLIGIAALGILFVLSGKIYGLFYPDQANFLAKENFKTLENKLSSLERGDLKDESEKQILFHVPRGWRVKSLDAGEQSLYPSLCLCKLGYFGSDDCKEAGLCKEFGKRIRLVGKDKKESRLILDSGFYDLYFKLDKEKIEDSTKILVSFEKINEEKISRPIESKERSSEDLVKVMEFAKINPVGGRKCLCEDNCENYAKWIKTYSEEESIPDALLGLSIMMQESGCVQERVSSSGCVGLMQICSWSSCGLKREDVDSSGEEETNIKCGLHILKGKYNEVGGKTELCSYKDDWKKAVRAYLSKTCSTKPTNYVEEVWSRYVKLQELNEKFSDS